MSELTCPYCEEEQRDTFELDEDGTLACGDCGKWFIFSSHVTRSFNSSRAPCLNDVAEHEWKQYGSVMICRTCNERKKVEK